MKDIYKTCEVKSDKIFLRRLANWIIYETGDVNVAQRLNCIVIQGKLGIYGGNRELDPASGRFATGIKT